MSSMTAWTELQTRVEKDIMQNGVPRGEFVVSNMTKAVENALHHIHSHFALPAHPILEIGAGTGYHSLMMLSMYQKKVYSVDINAQALDFAKERVAHFMPEVPVSHKASPAEFDRAFDQGPVVNFHPYALSDMLQFEEQKYAASIFNPPIIYPFFEIEIDKPATQGVYVANDDVKNVQNELVYQFYQHIAQKNLVRGSHILCVWSNLIRHLAELDPFEGTEANYVHPSEILSKWFGFRFDNEPESFEEFYCHTTVLKAASFNQGNTDDLYTRNIEYGRKNHLYSELLVDHGPADSGDTSFKFGVLHLVKTSDTENRFTIVNGSSKNGTKI